MALQHADSAGDTTASVGTGTVAVIGAAPVGYQTFAVKLTDGATYRYRIQDAANSEWEVNTGVWTASGSTMTRSATPYASSNGGSLVSFSAGTKAIVIVMTAADADSLASSVAAAAASAALAQTYSNLILAGS